MNREKLEEITRALKNSTESSRAVARRFGVSHTLALKIRNRRGRIRIDEPAPIAAPEGEFVRCPECGAKSKSPCVYCAIRKRTRSLVAINETSNNDAFDEEIERKTFREDDFALDLSPEEYDRYREVRRWREQRANPRFDVVPSDWPWLAETSPTFLETSC